MRIEMIFQLDVEPGEVFVVRPTERCRAAAAAAPVDPGPPSLMQDDHLRAIAARGPQAPHTAWTGDAVEISAPLPPQVLLDVLTRYVQTHEGMRTWFDLSPQAGPVRHLLAAEDVELELAPLDLDAPEDICVTRGAAQRLAAASDEDERARLEWRERLYHRALATFDEATRPDSWPPFALVVVLRPDGASLIWGCDHALTDGGSQVLFAGDLLAGVHAGLSGSATPLEELWGPAEQRESALTAIDAERAAAAEAVAATEAGDPPAQVSAWVEAITASGGMPRFPLDLGLAPGETGPTEPRCWVLLQGEEVAAFESRCKAVGGSMPAGIHAVLALAERRLVHRPEQHTAMSVLSTRDAAHARSQGWFTTFAPVSFAVPRDAPFDEVVAAAAKGVAQAKQIATLPAHAAIPALLASGACRPEEIGSPQMVSWLDLRWFPGAGAPGDDRARHFPGLGRTANASMWIQRDDSSVYVWVLAPDNDTARASVERYVATVQQVLREAVAT